MLVTDVEPRITSVNLNKHFVMDFLFPLLKNSKPGVDDRGHRFRSRSPLTNYPHASIFAHQLYTYSESIISPYTDNILSTLLKLA